MDRLDHYLQQSERILWEGQPDPSKLFTGKDLFLVPFSLLWGGFAIFWESGVLGLWGKGAPAIFVLWGIPFVLMGLYFIFGRFFYKAWRKRRTVYAVTDQRVLSLVNGKLKALYLDTLPGLEIDWSPSSATGSIIFGSHGFQAGMYANTGLEFFGHSRFGGGEAFAFYDIPEPDRVYQLVTCLRQKKGGA